MQKRMTVYIVDDEPMIRKALMRSVESLEVNVCAFPTAELCLSALEEEECSLLVTDMNLPGMSGIDLLGTMRELHPTIGVMLITGFGSVNTAVKSMQLGAMDFIEKPLDETILLPKIRAALDKISPPDSSNELSHAESEIVALIGQGLANKEIAFRLKRSIRTVENHRHRIMKKIGATTSAELMKFALSSKGSR